MKSTIQSAILELRASLELHGLKPYGREPLRGRGAVRDLLSAYLGSEPHGDLVEWFSFVEKMSQRCSLVGHRALTVDDAISESVRESTTSIEVDPILVNFKNGESGEVGWHELSQIDWLPIQACDSGGYVAVCPTHEGSTPRVVMLGEASFFYRNVVRSDMEDDRGIHSELPTLPDWLVLVSAQLRAPQITLVHGNTLGYRQPDR